MICRGHLEETWNKSWVTLMKFWEKIRKNYHLLTQGKNNAQ